MNPTTFRESGSFWVDPVNNKKYKKEVVGSYEGYPLERPYSQLVPVNSSIEERVCELLDKCGQLTPEVRNDIVELLKEGKKCTPLALVQTGSFWIDPKTNKKYKEQWVGSFEGFPLKTPYKEFVPVQESPKEAVLEYLEKKEILTEALKQSIVEEID